MKQYCLGRVNAKFREKILDSMPSYITDRKFRRIIHALAQEGHVYSSASFGYFFMPKEDPIDLDVEAAKHATLERKAKALSTLQSCDKNLRKLEGMRQGQRVFIQGGLNG